MRFSLLLLALLLTAGACSGPPRDGMATDDESMTEEDENTNAEAMPVALNEPFVVEAGETLPLADTGVTLRFDEIASDNRCPADVNCVQGGEAVVRFTLLEAEHPDMPFTLRIDGGITEMQDIDRYPFPTVDRFVAALLLLQPYPGLHDEADMPMTATLEVRKLTR